MLISQEEKNKILDGKSDDEDSGDKNDDEKGSDNHHYKIYNLIPDRTDCISKLG